jgi:hypothetical protein
MRDVKVILLLIERTLQQSQSGSKQEIPRDPKVAVTEVTLDAGSSCHGIGVPSHYFQALPILVTLQFSKEIHSHASNLSTSQKLLSDNL